MKPVSMILETWFENHIGLPLILIALGIASFFVPRSVLNFFYPERKIPDILKKEDRS